MNDIQMTGYQLETPLIKQMSDDNPRLYKIGCIIIRIRELQNRACYMTKCNKPTSAGTKMTFQLVKDAEEYKREFQKIISEGEELGMTFQTRNKEGENAD